MRGERAERFVVFNLRLLAASFAIVGLLFITMPDRAEERRAENRLIWQPPQMDHPLMLDVAALFEGIEGDE